MYSVVANVKEYKHFVPWCVDSTILTERDNYLEAELKVGFRYFSEKYVSKVYLVPGKSVIAKSRDTTVFHYLTNEWRFESGPDANSCWLYFDVEFAFQNMLYSQISSFFFNEVVKQMVSAFEKRCGVVPVEALPVEAVLALSNDLSSDITVTSAPSQPSTATAAPAKSDVSPPQRSQSPGKSPSRSSSLTRSRPADPIPSRLWS